ncbi:LPXTG cell wall anchor domain-containing protein [Lactobacillus hamsteri]|uniref:Mucus binding protein Mub n=1 Tax=Lactobacillus hamsteri DSM 5661 = JCM 6256 TaxID=1423754 RepID=A0A0R1YEG0_9LACO|nr:GbpC/Spa domain-containing protein [Lactobacillus hamsteri]KRM40862.1 mucus binding protein precursor Mub [Lactobacillus hamsteri DSM 5661 = JCM 6256]
MVSRRNLLEKIRKIEERHEHHSIRKFTMGAASVLVGLTFMGTNTRPVKASKTRKDDVVLVETQSTENEATEQSILQQYTTENTDTQIQSNDVSVEQTTDTSTSESADAQTTTDTKNTDSVTQENVSSPTDNSNQEVTNETASQAETKQPTYQDSLDKVNDINNNVNNDLKDIVDEASKTDGVTVEPKDPNKINTTVGDIDKNADKIKEDNEKQIAEIEKQLADYKVKLDQYKNDLEKYNTELAEYNRLRDEYIAKLKDLGLWKEGDVDPSDISQDLVLDKEENTKVDVIISNNHTGIVTKGKGTILKDEKGNPLLMNHYLVKDNISGDFLTVVYTNFETSTYAGEKIGKIEVIYSDFVISNNSYQGNSLPGIYFGKRPTDGFFYKKANGVTIELKMYDKNGKLINLKDNTAYITVGSLNNGSSSSGHKEYVEKAEILSGGSGVALPESSVTIHKGPNGDILYADKDNELLYDGKITDAEKELAISIWGEEIVNRYLNWDDSKDRGKEIFGAGLFKVSGNSIKIRFSNELGSAWATFSTTVPQLAFKGEKPTEPIKPAGITINWQPGELVLNDSGKVYVHYVDVNKEFNSGIKEFDPLNLSHGFELLDYKQGIEHLAVDDNYTNSLWDWSKENYILATTPEKISEGATAGKIESGEKHYYIYLRHATTEDTRNKEVNQTIHYVYKDSGKEAAPDHVSQTLVFTQTGIKDWVTDKTDWNGDWTLTQTFVTVTSPTIKGYHTDRPEVGPYDITVDNSNFDQNLDKEDTVYYVANPTETVSRDKEVNQTIHYVYKDSGKEAAPDHVSQTLVFTQTGIKDLITNETDWNGGWTLTQTFVTVTSPTIKGYHTDRPEVGPYDITVDNSNFDQNLDKEDTVYYVANPTETVSRDKEVNQTIHYVYEDGTTAAPDHISQTLVFTQTGIKDLITNETDWNGDWTLTQIFETVTSPTIKGYHTDRPEVGPYDITVDNSNFDQNLDKEDTVIYKANPAQPTTPPDQPTDPTNPTTPQPTVPETPDPEPTVPTQPTDPEVPTETPEIPEENETVTPHPEETPSEEEKKETVTPKSQETKRDDGETTTVTPKTEKAETVINTNVSTTKTRNGENVEKAEESEEATLPQTGSKETDKAGAAGLIAATVGSLIGLAGAEKKKRKKNN